MLEAQLAYWRRRLANRRPAIDIPSGRPRPAKPSLTARFERLMFIGEMGQMLREAGREAGCTMPMVLLAGINALQAWRGARAGGSSLHGR